LILLKQLLACAISLAACSAVVASNGPAERWWAHVRFLADDALEGRETGTPGYQRAAE
jgi:hypothetical protein